MGLPDPATDSQQADAVGGEDDQVNELARDIERLQRRLNEYVDSGVPNRAKSELAGAMSHLALTFVPMAEDIKPGIIFGQRPDQEPTEEAEAEIRDGVVTDDSIGAVMLKRVTTIVGCCCCPSGSRQPVRYLRPWPNEKRPEWHQLGFCADHDTEQDEIGEGWEVQLWSKYRGNLINYFYEMQFALSKEIAQLGGQ